MAVEEAIGSAIAGIGHIVGGVLGAQSAASNRHMAEAQFDYNAQMQEQMAKNAILFRVQDAKRAGIHPLAALGNPGMNWAPQSIVPPADNSLGEGLSRAGQNFGRAIAATSDRQERQDILQASVVGLQMAKTQAEIDFINARTRSLNLDTPPGVGGMVSGGLRGQNIPIKAARLRPDDPATLIEQDYQWVRTDSGRYYKMPSKQVHEQGEDWSYIPTDWFVRHRAAAIGETHPRGPHPAPPGFYWKYFPETGEYEMTRDNRGIGPGTYPHMREAPDFHSKRGPGYRY